MKAGASFFFFLRIQLCNFEGRGQFCSSVIIKNTRLYAKIKFPLYVTFFSSVFVCPSHQLCEDGVFFHADLSKEQHMVINICMQHFFSEETLSADKMSWA